MWWVYSAILSYYQLERRGRHPAELAYFILWPGGVESQEGGWLVWAWTDWRSEGASAPMLWWSASVRKEMVVMEYRFCFVLITASMKQERTTVSYRYNRKHTRTLVDAWHESTNYALLLKGSDYVLLHKEHNSLHHSQQ